MSAAPSTLLFNWFLVVLRVAQGNSREPDFQSSDSLVGGWDITATEGPGPAVWGCLADLPEASLGKIFVSISAFRPFLPEGWRASPLRSRFAVLVSALKILKVLLRNARTSQSAAFGPCRSLSSVH
jgi:hypothetical protein